MIEKGDIVIKQGKRYKVKSTKPHLDSCTIRSLDGQVVFFNVKMSNLKKCEKRKKEC